MSLYTVNTGDFVNAADINQLVTALAGSPYNVKSYGALGNNAADDTSAIAAAITAASSAGGTVFFPPGTYLTGNQTLASNVYLQGSGIGATTIKLKNGANTDLFSAFTSSINLSATFGAGVILGVVKFGLSDLTLDGNKANQSSGTSYPLRFYGYDYLIKNLTIVNGYTGGILCDWTSNGLLTGTSDTVESFFQNIRLQYCNGIGIQIGGPTDCQWHNVNVNQTGSHCVHIAPNADGLQMNLCHFWTLSASAIPLLVETYGVNCANCEAESADTANVVVANGGFSWYGGRVFAGGISSVPAGTGFQLGQQAGETPYAGQILQSAGVTLANTVLDYNIDTMISNIISSHGAIWFDNDSGGKINCRITGPNPDVVEGDDTFASRTVGSGFGTASDGQTYTTIFGTTSGISVGSNKGTISSAAGFIELQYGSKTIKNADTTVRFTLGSSGDSFALDLRATNYAAGTLYRAVITTTQLSIERHIAGVNTVLISQAISVPTATLYHIRFRAVGSFLYLRYWADAGSEPAYWHLIAMDTQITAAGNFGLLAQATTATSITLDHLHVIAMLDPFTGTVHHASQFAFSGPNALTQSIQNPDPGNSGIIQTAGLKLSGVAPAANRTGLILQPGTYPNQTVTVVNSSAFSLTFAASGTSNVADGVSAVISANRKMDFTWEHYSALWYRS